MNWQIRKNIPENVTLIKQLQVTISDWSVLISNTLLKSYSTNLNEYIYKNINVEGLEKELVVFSDPKKSKIDLWLLSQLYLESCQKHLEWSALQKIGNC